MVLNWEVPGLLVPFIHRVFIQPFRVTPGQNVAEIVV